MNHFGYSPRDYGKFVAFGKRFLILFSLLYCALYCCRLNLSNAAPLMMRDLGWDKADIGIITGSLFWSYGLGQAINGRLSEIFGPYRFLIAGSVLSVAANLVFSFQTSLAAMILIWCLNGYFQSMTWTPGLACLTQWWPAAKRGFATGVAHAFSGFGQAAATASVSAAFLLMPGLGWRSAFLLPALLPLLALLFFLLLAKASPAKIDLPPYQESVEQISREEKRMANIATTQARLYPYRYLLGKPAFLLWLFVAFATGFARYGLVTWIPLYFIDQFRINITEGLLASLSLPAGMGLGTLVVPWLSDHLYLRNRLRACLHCALAGAAAVALLMLFDPRIAIHMVFAQLLLFMAGFAIYAINGTAWAFATDLGGRVFSGTAAGALNFSAYMGAAAQSFIYGFLLEHYGWNMIFWTISSLCLAIAAISFFSDSGQNRSGAN